MKFIKSDDLKLGMRLAKPIYNRDGVMLYERNSKLTRQGIVSIQNFGLIGVYILEPAEPVPPMSADDIEFERFQAMSIFTIREILDFFQDFYTDFSRERAEEMLKSLGIDPAVKMRTLSKGTKEKVQLILVMSRNASLYILDEPIAGVDPAARDYILRTIINNYNPEATVLISTHLIEDVEQVLDEVIFMRYGQLVLYTSVDNIREEKGKSVDAYFREVFAC